MRQRFICELSQRMHLGMENPHIMVERVCESLKVNVFFAISSCKVYESFFFVEPTVTDINYLNMLQLWLMPQLLEDSEDFIFQKMDPPHTSILTSVLTSVLIFLVTGLGLTSNSDSPLLPWPPWSSDLTPRNFLWGYIKDRMYMPPMPHDLPQLRQNIMDAVAAVDLEMLQCVW